MASSQSIESPPVDGSMVANWDFHFNWTKDHLSWEDLDPLRHEHDELGAAAYDRLIAIRDAQAATGAVESQLPLEHGKKPDLLALLRDNHTKDPILGQFWEEVNCVPDWVDWEQIERGQRVFYRYIGGNIFSFYGLSISNGAIPGIVEVLMRTGGSSTKSMLFRTFETFSYVLQVTRGLGAVQPGGDGHAATVRVRLLHAAVRCRMRTLIATRPEYFDETALGVPLNDLVSMYTVLGFAGSAPWLYLSCQGVFPKAQEIEDHVALHRYLGYVMGAPIERFCATTAKTKAATESCFYHMVRTSPRSGAFVNNFIECLLEIPSAHVSRSFLEAAARWTNGHKLCDALDLGRPGPYYYALCAGHSMLCSALVYLQRAIPSLDEFIIEYSRTGLKKFITEGKIFQGTSSFDFKWVPKHDNVSMAQDSKMTEEEKRLRAAGLKPPRVDRWIERAYLRLFIVGCIVLGLGLWGAVCLMAVVFKMVPPSVTGLSTLVRAS